MISIHGFTIERFKNIWCKMGFLSFFKKGKSNGRLLDEFDIFFWQGKCQI